MSGHAETFTRANRELDDMGNSLMQGANMAPRLTMDTIIAMRAILDRHRPVVRDRFYTGCVPCGTQWPCLDAAAVLKVLGLPEDDERTNGVLMPDTNFVETEALLALMREDTATAAEIIDGMHPSERAALAAAAKELARRADDTNRCPGCGHYIERHEPWVSVGGFGGEYQEWHSGCRGQKGG